MSLGDRAASLTKNQRAVAGIIKIAAFGVIVAVVLYCDIQFIQVMWKTFPDGFAKIFSMIGAVATGASVIALIGAEAYWFSRGPQMVTGWIFTGIEVIISVLNVILSFELSGGSVDPFMAAWQWICPGTPVVAALFWVIIFNLDEGQKARHEEREMQDDLAEAERAHKKAVHESKMNLKKRYLESTTTYLDQIADDPRVQAGLQAGAWKFAGEQLRELTGLYLPMPMQQALPPAEKTVNANPPTPESPAPVTPPPVPTQSPTKKRRGFLGFGKKEELPVFDTPKQMTQKEAKEQVEQVKREIREEREQGNANASSDLHKFRVAQQKAMQRPASPSSSVADRRRARRASRFQGAPHPGWGNQAFDIPAAQSVSTSQPDPQTLPFQPAPSPTTKNGANGAH